MSRRGGRRAIPYAPLTSDELAEIPQEDKDTIELLRADGLAPDGINAFQRAFLIRHRMVSVLKGGEGGLNIYAISMYICRPLYI